MIIDAGISFAGFSQADGNLQFVSSSAGASDTAGRASRDTKYYVLWEEWKRNGPSGGGELRDVAVKRLRDCLARRSDELDLSYLGLTSWPDVPPHVKVIMVEGNDLPEFPVLPADPRTLDVGNNLVIFSDVAGVVGDDALATQGLTQEDDNVFLLKPIPLEWIDEFEKVFPSTNNSPLSADNPEGPLLPFPCRAGTGELVEMAVASRNQPSPPFGTLAHGPRLGGFTTSVEPSCVGRRPWFEVPPHAAAMMVQDNDLRELPVLPADPRTLDVGNNPVTHSDVAGFVGDGALETVGINQEDNNVFLLEPIPIEWIDEFEKVFSSTNVSPLSADNPEGPLLSFPSRAGTGHLVEMAVNRNQPSLPFGTLAPGPQVGGFITSAEPLVSNLQHETAIASSFGKQSTRFRGTSEDARPFRCDWAGCDKAFTEKSNLLGHTRIHTGERPYKCDWTGCDKAFKQKITLQLHTRIHTGERPYKCDWTGCDKAFKQKITLQLHTRSHTGERPYKCNWTGCDKAFAESGVLLRHTRVHTGERPYKCDWSGCDKAFKRSNGLQNHSRIHTGERPYKCDWTGCDKAFRVTGPLIRHKRIHTGERPYKCDWAGCDKAFTEQGPLIRHKRIHTGERPYKCDWAGCDKAFTEPGPLQSHKRIHTGEKPCKCDWTGCDKTFTEKSTLRNHKRVHTRERPYKCDWTGCDRAYAQRSTLHRHERIHSVGPPELC